MVSTPGFPRKWYRSQSEVTPGPVSSQAFKAFLACGTGPLTSSVQFLKPPVLPSLWLHFTCLSCTLQQTRIPIQDRVSVWRSGCSPRRGVATQRLGSGRFHRLPLQSNPQDYQDGSSTSKGKRTPFFGTRRSASFQKSDAERSSEVLPSSGASIASARCRHGIFQVRSLDQTFSGIFAHCSGGSRRNLNQNTFDEHCISPFWCQSADFFLTEVFSTCSRPTRDAHLKERATEAWRAPRDRRARPHAHPMVVSRHCTVVDVASISEKPHDCHDVST